MRFYVRFASDSQASQLGIKGCRRYIRHAPLILSFKPYYREGHVAYRAKVREFVESEMRPIVEELLEKKVQYPAILHQKVIGLLLIFLLISEGLPSWSYGYYLS